ncbi:MAG: hypothetical protein M0P69_08170, partial [Bacteroidales bacterium]|nr:hypothetical protein [Bacteroidales bacterium]
AGKLSSLPGGSGFFPQCGFSFFFLPFGYVAAFRDAPGWSVSAGCQPGLIRRMVSYDGIPHPTARAVEAQPSIALRHSKVLCSPFRFLIAKWRFVALLLSSFRNR